MATARRLLHPVRLAAVAWAGWSVLRVRRHLDDRDLRNVRVPAPPAGLPHGARDAVQFALRRLGTTCLQRSLVLQAWDRAHGRGTDVVIGVTAPGTGFRAHAWLDGEQGCDGGEGFQELLRVRA